MFEHPRRVPTETTPIRIRPPDDANVIQEALKGDEQRVRSTFGEAIVPQMPRWLSVEQVRKMQRMRRQAVLDAMRRGDLPFEKRGRICYIRLTDIIEWEQRRVVGAMPKPAGIIHPALGDLA